MSREIQYGAILSAGTVPESLPGALSFAMIPGEMLETLSAPGRVPLLVRDLAAPELAALLPEQNTALKAEFSRFFRERCRKAAALSIPEVGIRFDWERAFADEAYQRSLLLLLRGTFGILEEYRLTLRLAIRPQEAAGRYRTLVRDLLYPHLGLTIEGAPETAEADLAPLRFYSDSFVLLPEAESARNWTRTEIDRLLEHAGEYAASPRRIGILTDHMETAAELAAEDKTADNPAAEQGELSLC